MRGTWIEIVEDMAVKLGIELSCLMRGTWIEIAVNFNLLVCPSVSCLMRGTWIEIFPPLTARRWPDVVPHARHVD